MDRLVDACLDGFPVPNQENEAVPRRHVPATGEEDRADAVLMEQPVLDRFLRMRLLRLIAIHPASPTIGSQTESGVSGWIRGQRR